MRRGEAGYKVGELQLSSVVLLRCDSSSSHMPLHICTYSLSVNLRIFRRIILNIPRQLVCFIALRVVAINH
jgi:hypothetical protein